MITALIYTVYTIIAIVFSVIVMKRMNHLAQQWDNDAMAVLCRFGILLLTVGTVFDNARAAFGNILPFDQTDNTINTVVSFFCAMNHQWLASFCVFIPFCFVQKLVTTDRWKKRIPRIAVCSFIALFLFAGFNYLSKVPNPMYVKTECAEVDPTFKLGPSKKVKFSLFCVFAYQFGMVGVGVLMTYKYGCWPEGSRWHLIFLVANFLCLPGQALVRSLGPYYECFGSNFWEQLTFGSAIVADMILNITGTGFESSAFAKDDQDDRQSSYVEMDKEAGEV
jgi:hypothetical protein